MAHILDCCAGIAVQVMARETASRGNVNRSQAVAQTVQGRLGHLDPSMVQFNYVSLFSNSNH